MPLYRARLRARASLAGAAGGFGRDRGGHIPSAGYVAQRHEWRNDERGHVQHSQLSRRCQTCTETLVDYRGFRLLAVSVLPVSRKTICYGSHDAGLTVHSDYPAFNRKLKGTYASPLLPLPRFVPSHHRSAFFRLPAQRSSPASISRAIGSRRRYSTDPEVRALPHPPLR
jgi:hypothetical protein